MEKIWQMPLEKLAGLSHPCSCGRVHQVGIRSIQVGSGCLKGLPELIEGLGARRPFLLADPHTYQAAGRQVEELLRQAKIPFHGRLYDHPDPLVPNEYALGSALAALEPEDDLLVAVGSGTLNDTAKYLSVRTGVPYLIVATAPSMDGYASTVAPLILDGVKTTRPAVYPQAIVADVDILKEAPMAMLTAGFGDIAGKFTALADWRLSVALLGEYYCQESVALMERALEQCVENAPGLARRDPQAVEAVTRGLILSGVAMGLVGNSRPASGAEHHMAHFWEMDALRRGEEHPLHGNAVGAAAVASATLYQLAAGELPQGFAPPDKGPLVASLEAAGCRTNPRDLGISRELFLESVLHAMEMRDRFTILRLLDGKGLLQACAIELVNQFYPK